MGFWWRNLDAGTLEWDERMFRLHHRDPREGTPSLDEFLSRHVHPLDRDLLVQRQARHIADWPEASELTFRIQGPDGQPRWVQSWTRRLWRDGQRLSFGMHVDVTAEREAQALVERERERDRFAIDAAGVGVWEITFRPRATHWNRAMHALFGADPAAGLTPEAAARAALEPSVLATITAALQECRRGGLPFRVEHEVRWPDGTRRWLLSTGRLQRDAAGEPLTISGVAVDITERRHAEQLARERDRAEQASLAKSDLMARVSHELRTPMNAVLGFTELMALDTLSPPQRERLSRIRAAGSHLLALIDDLLSLSRAEADTGTPRLEPVRLPEVLGLARLWVAGLAQSRGITLLADEAGAQLAWVRAERPGLGAGGARRGQGPERRAAPAPVRALQPPGRRARRHPGHRHRTVHRAPAGRGNAWPARRGQPAGAGQRLHRLAARGRGGGARGRAADRRGRQPRVAGGRAAGLPGALRGRQRRQRDAAGADAVAAARLRAALRRGRRPGPGGGRPLAARAGAAGHAAARCPRPGADAAAARAAGHGQRALRGAVGQRHAAGHRRGPRGGLRRLLDQAAGRAAVPPGHGRAGGAPARGRLIRAPGARATRRRPASGSAGGRAGATCGLARTPRCPAAGGSRPSAVGARGSDRAARRPWRHWPPGWRARR